MEQNRKAGQNPSRVVAPTEEEEMFRASSAHLQEDTVVHMQHMVLSLSMRVPGGL